MANAISLPVTRSESPVIGVHDECGSFCELFFDTVQSDAFVHMFPLVDFF